jgi:hypothetical protein
MPINVVCPGCKKRFSVSEKFAGQQGPCPKCKTVIQIPALEEQVVVHAPEDALPKDSKGRSVVMPVLREESRFSLQFAVLIGFGVLLLFGLAAIVGRSYEQANVPIFLQGLAALALGPALAMAGYSFLRNDELQPYSGPELWLRAGACGVAYAVLWGAYAWIQYMWEIDFDVTWLVYVVPPLILAGGFVAFASLDLDYLSGLMHYGLYLLVTVLLRLSAGMTAF